MPQNAPVDSHWSTSDRNGHQIRVIGVRRWGRAAARGEGEGLLLPGPPSRSTSTHTPNQQKQPRPTDLPALYGALGVCQQLGTRGVARSREKSHPAAVPAWLQSLRPESSLSLGKHFLLLSEINRERKDFQVPPCCNDFSPTYSLSSPKIEELFKKDARRKKELNRGKGKEKMEPQGGGEKQNEKTAKVKKRDEK